MENLLQSINNEDRVWVYQAGRLLSDDEVALLNESGNRFVATWAAHGKPLRAAVHVVHNLFVIVSVDEHQALASGCSIDKSVNWVTAMEQQLGIDLMNRQLVAWMDESSGLQTASLSEFETLASNGLIEEDTLVFNNLVFSGKELKNGWLVPVRESWHARYLKSLA